MLEEVVDCRMIFQRRVWDRVRDDAAYEKKKSKKKSASLGTNLSKIITAGVIRVAEPAATSVSAARSSPSRLRLRWMPKGIVFSWRSCVMAYIVS